MVKKGVVFLYPGQGSLYPTCGDQLKETFPSLITPAISAGLNMSNTDSAVRIFSISRFVSDLLRTVGVIPDAVLGYSSGEYAAAVDAEILSERDAEELIEQHFTIVDERVEVGGMLALPVSYDRGKMITTELKEQRGIHLWMAGDCSPNRAIICGEECDALQAQKILQEQYKIMAMPVNVTRAYHSPMIGSIAQLLDQCAEGFTFNEAQLPMTSNASGGWMTSDEATDPRRWSMQLSTHVRFRENLQAVQAKFQDCVFVEVGPGAALSALTVPQLIGSNVVISMSKPSYSADNEATRLLRSLVELHSHGVPVDFSKLPEPALRLLETEQLLQLKPEPQQVVPSSIIKMPLKLGGELQDDAGTISDVTDTVSQVASDVDDSESLSSGGGSVSDKVSGKSIVSLIGQMDPEVKAVAIVGMACRLPGHINSPEEFWTKLLDGHDAIAHVPPERWNPDDLGKTKSLRPSVVESIRHGGFVDDVEMFDSQFFDISEAEAREMDPQQRLMMEVSYEAFHDAGYDCKSLDGANYGVYIGAMASDWKVMKNEQDRGATSLSAHATVGTADSVLSGRISFALGLTGPSVVIDTACSSSLVALHHGVRALQYGECDAALVGGVNLMLHYGSSLYPAQASMLSADGHCKTFDSRANGYVRSEAVAAVVIKRLVDVNPQDNVLAVVRGIAVKQDGKSASLTAPHTPAQVDVMMSALRDGGLSPDSVTFLEAHGTGTPTGDPIEAAAIRQVFGERKNTNDKPLAVGAVKSNIGHTEPVAGLAGLIKAVMMLQRCKVPPNLHLKEMNPKVAQHLSDMNIVLPSKVMDMNNFRQPGQPIHIGVNSYGFSGTIAHVVLEEAGPAYQRSRQPVAPHVWNRKSFPWYHVPHLMHTHIQELQSGARYTAHIDGLLRDVFLGHKVHGVPVIPGAALLEMTLASILDHHGMPPSCVLSDVTFMVPTTFPLPTKDSSLGTDIVQLSCTIPKNTGRFTVQTQGPGEGSPISNAGGVVAQIPLSSNRPHSIDVEAIKSRCEAVPGQANTSYEFSAALGIQYGPQFKVINDAWVNDNEALAFLTLPSVTREESFYIHPALFDGSINVTTLILNRLLGGALQPGKAYIPFAVEKLIYVRSKSLGHMQGSNNGVWAHVDLVSVGEKICVINVTIADAAGNAVVHMHNMRLALASPTQIVEHARCLPLAGLYSVQWHGTEDVQAASEPSTNGMPSSSSVSTLVLTVGDTKMARALQKVVGQSCVVCNQDLVSAAFADEDSSMQIEVLIKQYNPQHVVFVTEIGNLGDTAAEMANGLVKNAQLISQAVLKSPSVSQLVLVTFGATALATSYNIVLEEALSMDPGMLGIARGLRNDLTALAPNLRVLSLDMDSDGLQQDAKLQARAVVAQMEAVMNSPVGDVDLEVAYRRGNRFVPRLHMLGLVRQTHGQAPQALPDDGVYIVTGGLGALGLLSAKVLLTLGAKHVALISRSGKVSYGGQGLEDLLQEVQSVAGATVLSMQCDVSSYEAVQKLMEDINARFCLPVKGIIHSAGVLRDGLISQQKLVNLTDVYRAKAMAAWNLHRASLGMPLSTFVVYSSVAALMGNIGQTNYCAANNYMESLMVMRRQQGLPGVAIQWAAVSEIGMASVVMDQQKLEAFGALSPQGVEASLQTVLETKDTPPVVAALSHNLRSHLNPLWKRNRIVESFVTPPASQTTSQKSDETVESGATLRVVASELQVGQAAVEAGYAVKDDAPLAATGFPVPSPMAVQGPSVSDVVMSNIAGVIGYTPGMDDNLLSGGVDSLGGIELCNKLASELQVDLPSTFIFDNPTPSAIITSLQAMVGAPDLVPQSAIPVAVPGVPVGIATPVTSTVAVAAQPVLPSSTEHDVKASTSMSQHGTTRTYEEQPSVQVAPKVVFLFTGQGSQFLNMALGLYLREPVFKAAMNECNQHFKPLLALPLLTVLYPNLDQGEESASVKIPDSFWGEVLNKTQYAQPAIFSVSYALAALWLSRGVKPEYVIGHSIGEYAAACVCGVMDVATACRLVAMRGELMQALPTGQGAMMAVRVAAQKVLQAIDFLPEDMAKLVAVAAANAPQNTVISGDITAINEVLKVLNVEGKRLQVSHAFHSPLMQPMLGEFHAAVEAAKLNPPAIPFVSTLIGRQAGGELALPGYWVQHIPSTVRFQDAFQEVLRLGGNTFIEIGPQPTLVKIGAQMAKKDNRDELTFIPSLPAASQETADVDWRRAMDTVQQHVQTPGPPTSQETNAQTTRMHSVAGFLPSEWTVANMPADKLIMSHGLPVTPTLVITSSAMNGASLGLSFNGCWIAIEEDVVCYDMSLAGSEQGIESKPRKELAQVLSKVLGKIQWQSIVLIGLRRPDDAVAVLMLLANALSSNKTRERSTLWVVTRGAVGASRGSPKEDSNGSWHQSELSVWVCAEALKQQHTWLSCVSIDVDANSSLLEAADLVGREMEWRAIPYHLVSSTSKRAAQVVFRGGQRLVGAASGDAIVDINTSSMTIPPSVEQTMLLFAIPFLGGSARYAFATLASRLPFAIQLVPVDLPNRSLLSPTTMTDHLEVAVSNLASRMEACGKPYAILGHSMGGLVAYLTALAATRNPPKAVLVSASNNPSVTRSLVLSRILVAGSKTLTIYGLRLYTSLYKIGVKQIPKLMQGKVSLPDRKGAIKVLSSFSRQDMATLLKDPVTIRKLVWSCSLDALYILRYSAAPERRLSVPLTVFHSPDDDVVGSDSIRQWSDFTSTQCKFVDVPGGHMFIFNPAACNAMRQEIEKLAVLT